MERNTVLNTLEKAMGVAKASMNSNYFNKFGQTTDLDNVQTLYEYYQKQFAKDLEVRDADKLADENLMKYLVITVEDTQGFSADGKIDIIIDGSGHDVAIQYLDAKTDQMRLDIAPGILKNNEKMLEILSLGTSLSNEDVAKMLAPKDIDELVREIQKHGSVAMRSADDAKNRADEHDGKVTEDKDKINAETKENTTAEEERDAEIEAELQENKDIPEGMYSEIYKICKENDLNPSDLKQSLIINDPRTLTNEINNDITDISETGGEVLVLRFRNKEANAGADRIVMIQNGQKLREDESNNEKVEELMENHQGNGVRVDNFDDKKDQEMLQELEELQREYEREVQEIVDEYEYNKNLGTPDSVNLEEKRDKDLEDLEPKYNERIKDICDKYKPAKEAKENSTKDIEDLNEEFSDEEEAEEVESSTPKTGYTDEDFFDPTTGRRYSGPLNKQ